MGKISALPVRTQAMSLADVFILDQDISGTDTTVQAVLGDLKTFVTTAAALSGATTISGITAGSWTSAQLASALSDETGSAGGFVRATSPSLTSPTVATSLTASFLSASVLVFTNGSSQLTSTIQSGCITSANLATMLTDETGTGLVVFNNSPTIAGTPVFSAYTATRVAYFTTSGALADSSSFIWTQSTLTLGIGGASTNSLYAIDLVRSGSNFYHVDRTSTSFENGIIMATGGSNTWYFGQRAVSPNTGFHLYDYARGQDVVIIAANGDMTYDVGSSQIVHNSFTLISNLSSNALVFSDTSKRLTSTIQTGCISSANLRTMLTDDNGIAGAAIFSDARAVTGSKVSGAALIDLLTKLTELGIVTDSTSA